MGAPAHGQNEAANKPSTTSIVEEAKLLDGATLATLAKEAREGEGLEGRGFGGKGIWREREIRPMVLLVPRGMLG